MTRPRLALGFIIAALTSVSVLFGQEATPAASEEPKPQGVLYESPQGSYRLERSRDNKSVWVVSAKDPKEHQVLAGIAVPDEYPDPERFIASPDEKWLVAEGELFQQVSPLKFVVFRKKEWFKSNLESFAQKTFKPPSRHWIWTLGEWTGDSTRLEISITWPDSNENTEGKMAFNARTKEFERLP